MRRPAYLPLLLLGIATGCGGNSTTNPDPTPTPGFPVGGFVFYDENANGIADPAEVVRLPDVSVTIGGQTAITTTGGRFMVPDVPSGQQPVAVQPSTLPAYFAAGTPQNAAVPATADVAIPAVLTLGVRARPNVYLAFGDSITWGDGSTDLSGYRGYLRDRLHANWGKGAVEASGIPGTKSEAGSERAPGVLADFRPAYLLILYGTNDWNDPQCRDWFPCFTIDSLRAIVNHTRGAGAKPILATLPPVNPDYEDRNASARNAWVRQANDAIHALAQEEQVPVAEVHAEFSSQPSLPPLFNDFLHPNNDGYRLIANAFFEAITRPYPAASTSGMPILFALSARRP